MCTRMVRHLSWERGRGSGRLAMVMVNKIKETRREENREDI